MATGYTSPATAWKSYAYNQPARSYQPAKGYSTSRAKPPAPKPTGGYSTYSQPVTSSYSQPAISSGGGGGGGWSGGGGFKSSFNWQDYVPQLPQTPQVTQQLLAEWLKRAQSEAGMTFDPQLLAIKQQLESALLSAEATKGGISPAYNDIIKEISKWQEESLAAEQARHYARGFGRSGVLLEQEQEIGEKALEEKTAAKTEQARLIADIENQANLLRQQAGEQNTGIVAQKAQYITSRQSELRDSYETNQTALAQQQFQNQMAIAEFGLTAETQAFNQYLSEQQLSLDAWYQNQLMSLQQESAAMTAAATGSTYSSVPSSGGMPSQPSARGKAGTPNAANTGAAGWTTGSITPYGMKNTTTSNKKSTPWDMQLANNIFSRLPY